MKMFNDSNLEVKKFFKGTFFTHPYEAGYYKGKFKFW